MDTESVLLATQSANNASLTMLPFRLSLLLSFLYLLTLWLLLTRFVLVDARERSQSALFLKVSLFLVLFFNFPGLLLYLILRPPLTLREKERFLLEEELLKLEIKKVRKKEQIKESSPVE